MNVEIFNKFREKLSHETDKLEESIAERNYLEIPVNFCLVALLIRTIIQIVPNYASKHIKVYEIHKAQSYPHRIIKSQMPLRKFTGRIIHHVKLDCGYYMNLSPPSSPPSNMKYMRVLSDEDQNECPQLEGREFLTKDFIDIASKIAGNDREMLKHVLCDGIRNLKSDIDKDDIDNSLMYGKTHLFLTYISDIIGKIGDYQRFRNKTIPVYFEDVKQGSVIQIRESKLKYSYILQSFSPNWHILPEKYLETQLNITNINVKNEKTIAVSCDPDKNEKGTYRIALVIAEDLLHLLKTTKNELYP